jgi:hypothetical protein
MNLHDKQKKIVVSKARYKVIRAGRRAGKSVLQIERMIFDAVGGNDRNVYYLAPNQIQARDIIWLLLRKRLHGIAEFNEVRLECLIPTKDGGTSLIKLSGWENKENFRGKSAYSLTFDEIDTMRDFFTGWADIFRPTLIDTGGHATFVGTPKKENPNLRRLEKIAETDDSYECFHFTTYDNPFIPETERDELLKEYEGNMDSYKQEVMAEHVDDAGALFRYDALVDVFSNTVDKTNAKYMTVDIADDGSDKTIFSFWEGLEEYRVESYARLNTENIVDKIREFAAQDQIPFSHIAVDAIGVGAGVASNSLLDGIIGYKSSYSAIKTDQDIVRLPNVGYTPNAQSLTSNYRNLRSQCLFTLSDLVNNHKIASKVGGEHKDKIIEELSTYQDASKGDGKRLATLKEDVKASIGRSPDDSDTWIMRMYFVVKEHVIPEQTERDAQILNTIQNQFNRNQSEFSYNSNE